MRKSLLLLIIPFFVLFGTLRAQNVFDPNDPVITYNPATPPVVPGPNVMGKWVRTPRMNWDTEKFKCYYWNGIAFRLRYPSNYDPSNPNKKYPLILFFHGGGEIGPTTDNEFHLLLGAEMFGKMMDKGQFDAFMLFPQSQNVGWEETQFWRLNTLIDTLEKYCRVDQDRIIPMGLSIGGNATLWYSMLYPTKSTVAIPSSPAFVASFASQVDKFIHVPVWVGSGLVDNNPDPGSVSVFVNAFAAKGGSMLNSAYPGVGHASWDLQWKEPQLVQYWNNAHKANPLVFYQKNQIPQDSVINVKIGISPGYHSYEWQRNGVTIATGTNGANSVLDPSSIISFTGNELVVRAYGEYSVRFRRTASSPWSIWSPKPAVITPGPIARAFDINIDLPYANILDGRASTAAAGSTIVKYEWTKVSGPASYYILNPDQPATWINSVTKGIYVFRLTVTDNKGRTAFTDIRCTVNDGTQNQAPFARAGTNQVITLPVNSVTLDGSASTAAAGFTLTNYTWTKVSGPSQGTITSPNSAITGVTNLAAGVYMFRLSVTDSKGSNSTADVTVTVNGSLSAPPTANAGSNQTITNPVNSVTLNGSASTAASGKTLTGFAWQKISGPASSTIVSPNTASTLVNDLTAGIYVFRLTVTDNAGITATSDVTVTVNAATTTPPAGSAPVANAGPDITFVSTGYGFLNGTGSAAAAGSTIVTTVWTKLSGPSAYYMTSPNSIGTFLKYMAGGVYTFRLTVTDDKGLSGTDDVTVTVTDANPQPSPGQAPIAKAGANVTITLPLNNVTLDGSGSVAAPGSTITKYAWSKVGGPALFSFGTPNAVSTSVTSLLEGVYTFRLTVTDNQQLSSTSDVTVTVNPLPALPGTPPVANAGDDVTMLASSYGFLNGTKSAAAPGSTIVKTVWTKVSGPSQYYMTSPTAIGTFLKYMVVGNYVFRLTVTDDKGGSSSDNVSVNVVTTMQSQLNTRTAPLTENTLQVQAEKFDLYPSPAVGGFINMKWLGAYKGNATIHIYDFSGRRILSQNIRKEQNDYTNRININNLEKGIYYLEINLPGGKPGIRKLFLK